ncbi:MAG: YqaA family protein [Gammaproteobacteria bacterium]
MFQNLYDKTLNLAKHRHAVKYLCAVSFAESSFFPVPPDIMLAPMALSQPDKAMRFALWTTIASVIGGIFGYAIGYFMFDTISPWLQTTHYWQNYLTAEAWFKEWGFWAVFIAGFSPIPYKVFTIAAGTLQMVFLPFVAASFVGRGGRFFLVAMLLAVGGQKLESKLRQYIDGIGWATIALIVIGIGVYRYLH